MPQEAALGPLQERHVGLVMRLHPDGEGHLLCRHAAAGVPRPTGFASGYRGEGLPRGGDAFQPGTQLRLIRGGTCCGRLAM